MRIAILNQFFHPDHSATSQLMTELAESLVERGVRVTAVAGRGRYNGGASLPRRETHRGVKVRRAWSTGFGKGRMAGRVADYVSFYAGATWELLRMPRHDLVMALTTPPLISLVALAVARARRMRVVALVQDVYPDVAVALGALGGGGLAARLFAFLDGLTLRGSDRVIVLGECMRRRVAEKVGRSAADERIDVIHNWADGELISPCEAGARRFAAEHGLAGRFVVLFSGNLGRVNEFDTVLDAARLLRGRRDILFLFIGDGDRAADIRRFAESHGLTNVMMLPYQSRERLRESLSAGGALLVTLAEGLAGLSVPSKTYGILAAGKPVLYVGDAESCVARLVAEHGCGAVVASGEGARLAELVASWADDPAQPAACGKAARALFEERFGRERAVSAYLESFAKCLQDDGDVLRLAAGERPA